MKQLLLGILILAAIPSGKATDCYNCENARNNLLPQVPEWPIEYTTIEKINYERNSQAVFCKRPVEMVDTIVLHHSETPSLDTPERINDFHLSRGSASDPWYMIAYTYAINAPYPGEKLPETKVTEGRPIDIVGAHAGKGILIPMDSDQKKFWAQGKITCGKENGEFTVDPKLERDGKISANVTTIGVVVIGNYAPFSRGNPNGYSSRKPRLPSRETQDLVARTSCQLQKKYPRIKNLKWHSFYHPTSCPGTIKQYMNQIKALTRKYGCAFN